MFVEGKVNLRVADIIYIETSRNKNTSYKKLGSQHIQRSFDIELELRGIEYLEKINSYSKGWRYDFMDEFKGS